MQETLRDWGSIPGWGRSPPGRPDNPPQYSCLENPIDRGAWWTTVHRVEKSTSWLKWQQEHTARAWVEMWKTPSELLITDQLPTATPCGSNMICRSRRSYPKCFPTSQLGARSLTPLLWTARGHHRLFRQLRGLKRKIILDMGSQLAN